MKNNVFKKYYFDAIIECLSIGLIFWFIEISFKILTGQLLKLDRTMLASFIYVSASIAYGLVITFILYMLNKFKNKWVEKINILSFCAATFIAIFTFIYIKSNIIRAFNASWITVKIFTELGVILSCLFLCSLLYLWFKSAFVKKHYWSFFFATVFSFNSLIIAAINLNNSFGKATSINRLIALNAFLLTSSLLLLGCIYLFLKMVFKNKDAIYSFSNKQKIVFLASLIIISLIVIFIQDEFRKDQSFASKNKITNKNELPNVLLITIDTLRADHLSCYGYNKINTTYIDSLAKDGILFKRAMGQSPWTAPSVASILTSLYPSTHHGGKIIWKNGKKRFGKIYDSSSTSAEILKRNGYFTSAILTNFHLIKQLGFSDGFDTFLNLDNMQKYIDFLCLDIFKKHKNLPYTPAEVVTTNAIEWLETNCNKPFFLWIHYMDPHFPYSPPPKYIKNSEYKGKLLHKKLKNNIQQLRIGRLNLNNQDKKYLVSLYDGEIKYVDDQIGILIKKLKELKLFNNSIIILTADHGEEFWEHDDFEHGHTVYNELLHVPLIFHLNDSFHFKRKRISEQIRLIDILPTLLKILKIENKNSIEGKSLLPLIMKKSNKNRVVFSEYTLYFGEKKSLIKGHYKVIFSLEQQKVELYNLQEDPMEQYNLKCEMPDLARQMLDYLLAIVEKSLKRGKIYEKGEKEEAPTLSPEIEQKLKALGYID